MIFGNRVVPLIAGPTLLTCLQNGSWSTWPRPCTARLSSLSTTTLGLIQLVGGINDASVPVELTDQNAPLHRIYVCGHSLLKHVDRTENLPSVNHADLSIIFVQAHNVSVLLNLSPKLPTLKIIVAIGEVAAASKELLDVWSKQREIRVMTLAECMYLLHRPRG